MKIDHFRDYIRSQTYFLNVYISTEYHRSSVRLSIRINNSSTESTAMIRVFFYLVHLLS